MPADYEIVHFAGHAIASQENPNYSALILAPPADGSASGALYSHEIAALDLANTRLVVLAACDTGAGPIRGREGVLSLARAFLGAGVPAVVQSLWAADDEASEDLFKIFYPRLRCRRRPGRRVASRATGPVGLHGRTISFARQVGESLS